MRAPSSTSNVHEQSKPDPDPETVSDVAAKAPQLLPTALDVAVVATRAELTLDGLRAAILEGTGPSGQWRLFPVDGSVFILNNDPIDFREASTRARVALAAIVNHNAVARQRHDALVADLDSIRLTGYLS